MIGSSAGAAAAPPPPKADEAPIEELVVTGQKATPTLQNVAIPASVASGQLLEEQHLDSLLALPQILPSADFHAYNANNVVVQVRGLGATAVSGGQVGQVGIYVDDMYQGRQNALSYPLHDLATVELKPGPQGTANGTNSIAGSLLINSALPSFKPGGEISATLGDYPLRHGQNFATKKFWGVVTGPVVEDVDAVRLTAYSDRQNGWARNLATGATVDDSAAQGVRLQNLYRTDNFSLRLIGQYDNLGQHAGEPLFNSNQISSNKTTLQQLINQKSSQLTIPSYQLPTDPATTDIGHNQNFEGHTSRLSANATWDITDHLSATSITAWQNYKIWPNNDGDWTALDINRQSGSHNWSTQRSEELRLASKDNQLIDWVAGYFYLHQRNNQISDTQYGRDYPLVTAWKSAFGPQSLWTPANVTGIAYEAQTWTQSETHAMFGQSTIHLDEQWSLTTGLRETWDHRNVVANQVYTNSAGGHFTAAQAQSIFNTNFGLNQGGEVESANLGGTVGVSYKPDKDLLFYASINRGYMPAGTQTSTLNAAALAAGGRYGFAQEKIIDGELGVKSKWLDDRLTANLNLYRGTLFNYQATIGAVNPTNGTISTYTANVKAVNTKGVEYETDFKATSWLKAGLIGSYNLANYQSFHNSPCAPEWGSGLCDLTGSRVYNAPHWSTNLWGELTQPVAEDAEAYLRTEYNHKSGSYIQSNNAEQSWQGAYGIVNAQLGTRLRGGDVDLSLWVHNIFNVQYMTYQTTGNNVNWAIFSDPVSAGITLNVKF